MLLDQCWEKWETIHRVSEGAWGWAVTHSEWATSPLVGLNEEVEYLGPEYTQYYRNIITNSNDFNHKEKLPDSKSE